MQENKATDWIVGICNSACNGVRMYRAHGSIDYMKEYIAAEVRAMSVCFDGYDFGSDTADDVELAQGSNSLYGFACFQEFHIEITATPMEDLKACWEEE